MDHEIHENHEKRLINRISFRVFRAFRDQKGFIDICDKDWLLCFGVIIKCNLRNPVNQWYSLSEMETIP
jgi:hypothetical protein